jgi:hypothetical protein
MSFSGKPIPKVLSEFAVRRFILSSEIHFRKTKNGIELGRSDVRVGEMFQTVL